jgi:hypothetical protein
MTTLLIAVGALMLAVIANAAIDPSRRPRSTPPHLADLYCEVFQGGPLLALAFSIPPPTAPLAQRIGEDHEEGSGYCRGHSGSRLRQPSSTRPGLRRQWA